MHTLYRINKESKSKIEEERYKPSLGMQASNLVMYFKVQTALIELWNIYNSVQWTVDMGGSVMFYRTRL